MANALVTPEMINGSHAVWGISDPALFGAPTAAAPASAPSALQRALAAQQRLQSVNPKLDNQTGNNSAVSYRDYAKANSAHGDGNIGVFGPSSFHKPAVPAPSLSDPVAKSQASNPKLAASHKPGNWSASSGFGLAETTDQQHLLAYFLVSFDSYQAADGLTGLGAIIGKAFLYIACVLSGECLDILTELKEVIDQFGSAAPEDYLWGAEQLLDAVGLWPLLPKIQAAMPWLMSFTMSMIPGWGDLYDLTSAVLGYDPITGDKLSKWMRVAAFVAALIPILSSAQVRAADNMLDAGSDIASRFEGYAARTAQRDLDAIPGSLLTSEVENYVTIGKHGDFADLPMGTPGDKATTLLWTVDDDGFHLIPEQTPWDSSRGIPSHTNISPRTAYFAGEAWRTETHGLTVNAGSRAYGYNWQYATSLDAEAKAAYDQAMQARYDRAVQYMRDQGININIIPLGQRK